MSEIASINSKYPKDFFATNRWILHWAGLWRPQSSNKYFNKFYTFYAILVFIFANLWFTSTEFLSLFYTVQDESAFIKNINFFLTHFMGAIKVIFWYFNGQYLIKIMNSLEEPNLQYESFKKFQPGNIAKQYKNIGKKYSLLFLLLAHATLISSYAPPTFAAFKYWKYTRNYENSTIILPTQLPYYSWMPFHYKTGLKYLLAIAYQAGPMFSYAYSIVGMDSLFMNIMNCIAGNVKIIHGAFSTLTERCIARENNMFVGKEKLMNSMNMELKKSIKHLQILLRASEKLEKIHRYVTFCQMTATLFILCTCLYLISIAKLFSKQFFAEFVYMMAMAFQLYLYCWFGNEVTLKFQEIPINIWKNNWIVADREFKRNMIFTMLRAERPIYFTAGKFSPLTLPTFMYILKTSYSIYALIKNRQD